MKKVLILAGVFFSSTTFAEELEISKGCEMDKDCVLFTDECRYLKAAVKEKLPEDSISFVIDKRTIYSWNPSKKVCPKNYFIPPVWPKNPAAKCVKNMCVVRSIPNKKVKQGSIRE